MNDIEQIKQVLADAPEGSNSYIYGLKIYQFGVTRVINFSTLKQIVGLAEEVKILCSDIERLARLNESKADRIAELEKYNLALANESHAKSERIEALKQLVAESWFESWGKSHFSENANKEWDASEVKYDLNKLKGDSDE